MAVAKKKGTAMDFEDIEWDEVDAAIAHEDAAQRAHAALVTSQGALRPHVGGVMSSGIPSERLSWPLWRP